MDRHTWHTNSICYCALFDFVHGLYHIDNEIRTSPCLFCVFFFL